MYKRRNRIYAVLLAGTLLGSMISGGCSRAWTNPEQEALKVTLLKVGKADAIALLTKEKAMVIDAGEEEDGEELVTFLTQQGIRKVDTLIWFFPMPFLCSETGKMQRMPCRRHF